MLEILLVATEALIREMRQSKPTRITALNNSRRILVQKLKEKVTSYANAPLESVGQADSPLAAVSQL